jgi:hypothetical protein
MSLRPSLRTFGLVFLTAVASCATPNTAAEQPGASESRVAATPAAPAPAREWEPWPPAAAQKPAAAPAAAGPTFRIVAKPGGYRIEELLETIGKSAGISFLYDSGNATFKQARVEFVGDHVIQEKDLFAWLQAVLAFRKLVIVPVGPKTADGKQQWFLMDQADPSLKSRPVFIDESEVFDYAERDGLYVVTTLRVRDTVDIQRARNSLSQISTQTAGIGRISDTGGRHFIVGDFAPVVASMKRLLDRINAETPAPAPTPAPPAASKSGD